MGTGEEVLNHAHLHLHCAQPQGQRIEHEAAATSAEELRQSLSQQGLLVQQLREKRDLLAFRRSVSPEAFRLFNQELWALIRPGITIPEP